MGFGKLSAFREISLKTEGRNNQTEYTNLGDIAEGILLIKLIHALSTQY